jgi:hypothetical protein
LESAHFTSDLETGTEHGLQTQFIASYFVPPPINPIAIRAFWGYLLSISSIRHAAAKS